MTLDSLRASLADRYRLERELGQGGMATVYLALDLKHQRRVAIKVLRPELAAALGPERFLREIATTAALHHPHILALYDSGEAAGFLYYVMPLVEGESLRDRLDREKQLPLDDALQIAREVADALSYAHDRGVIHRDVKPANILLESRHALVADFGIAKAVSAAGGDRLTQTGVAVGTPAYMSPEQAAGERELDGRSDLYALGCVLYEMLAGQPPFTGPTVESVVHQHLGAQPRAVNDLRPAVPAEIAGALQRALAKAPADRFAPISRFAEVLGAASLQGAASATPPAGRLRPRRPAVVAGAVATLLLGALGWWFAQRGNGPNLADDLVAVAPFDVLDPALAVWSEGMVDVLARNLDGAGPLRTVAPTAVIRRWTGRADRSSAAALGRATGARLAVYGQLLATRGDSVRAVATLYDVAADRALGDVEVRDQSASVDRVADSLTVGVLRELGRSRPIGAVRATAFRSTSLPALKAFLQGEQYFRRTQFDSALAAYQRAVDADSTLAVAWRRMSTALSWLGTPNDSLTTAYNLRAAALNHGQALRDSLMISADSLTVALFSASQDTMFRANRARLGATLRALVERYPDDPEVWHSMGDASLHFPVPGRAGAAPTLAFFDRAIAADSAYGESYIHAVWLALELEDTALARNYIGRYRAWSRRPDDGRARAFAAIEGVLDGQALPVDALAAAARERGDRALREVILATLRWPDSGEVAVQAARAGAAATPRDPFFGVAWPAALAMRGHLDAARLAAGGAVAFEVQVPPLIGTPAPVAQEAWRSWLRDPPLAEAPSPQPMGFNENLFNALPWWATQRDTVSLGRFAVAMQAAESRATGDQLPWLTYGRAAAAAYLALARADTGAAVSRFLALPDTVCSCPYDRIVSAQLFLARDRAPEALRRFAGVATLTVFTRAAEPRRRCASGGGSAASGERWPTSMPDTTRLSTALADRYRLERELASAGPYRSLLAARVHRQQGDLDAAVLAPARDGLIGRHRVELRETHRLEPGGVDPDRILEEPDDVGRPGGRQLPVGGERVAQPFADRDVVRVALDPDDLAFRRLQQVAHPTEDPVPGGRDVRLAGGKQDAVHQAHVEAVRQPRDLNLPLGNLGLHVAHQLVVGRAQRGELDFLLARRGGQLGVERGGERGVTGAQDAIRERERVRAGARGRCLLPVPPGGQSQGDHDEPQQDECDLHAHALRWRGSRIK
jgi:serine/threonine-protein kinase